VTGSSFLREGNKHSHSGSPSGFQADWFCYQQGVHVLHHCKHTSQMDLCLTFQSREGRRGKRTSLSPWPPQTQQLTSTKPVLRDTVNDSGSSEASLAKPTRQAKDCHLPAFNSKPQEEIITSQGYVYGVGCSQVMV
jgi:hypothetical protein